MYDFLTQHNFDIDVSEAGLLAHAHDASICEVMPACIVYPRNAQEISLLVKLVVERIKAHPSLSITMRSRGTCMSGGSLNDSIIVDTTKYMDQVFDISDLTIRTQPGALYKVMEAKTLASGLIMPTFTASKNLCGVGGMFANNCAGEQTLKYGKANMWIAQTKFIGVDGVERIVKPLTRGELGKVMLEDSWWGKLHQDLFTMIADHANEFAADKPIVSKNSSGYNLWDIWNEQTGIWDLNKLLCGSQGTLGITTEITWKLKPVEPHQEMVVVFLESMKDAPKVIDIVNRFSPSSIESYDDTSFKLAIRYAKDFIESMGFFSAIALGLRFIPELLRFLKNGLSAFMLVVELQGVDTQKLKQDAQAIYDELEVHNFKARIATSEADRDKYWRIRRESFNLLRKHLQGKRTAPFIDDTVVPVEYLSEYITELREILDSYKLEYTVAGHAGNGNFHVIPLMDFKDAHTIEIIKEVSEKVFALVKKYHGSISGEHNDGLIRTPFLNYMFSDTTLQFFRMVKAMFDPHHIFNPRKKVYGSKEYTMSHLVKTS